MEMENPLLLMGKDFKFYCLQLKNPVGIPKILMLFLVGMRVQCRFPIGMKFQGIFHTEDKFTADFSSGEGVPPGLVINFVLSSKYLQIFFPAVRRREHNKTKPHLKQKTPSSNRFSPIIHKLHLLNRVSQKRRHKRTQPLVI